MSRSPTSSGREPLYSFKNVLKIGAVAVLLTWAFNLWFVWTHSGESQWFGLPSLGQVGDSFGSVNALFTGLGIAGLAYTINLQLMENEEGRKADIRRSRERSLDARLNACTGLLQAVIAKAQLSSMQPTSGAAPSRFIRVPTPVNYVQIRSAEQSLKILLAEIRNGIDDNEWSREVEGEAIRSYILDLMDHLDFLVAPHPLTDIDGLFLKHNQDWEEFALEIDALRASFGRIHATLMGPAIAAVGDIRMLYHDAEQAIKLVAPDVSPERGVGVADASTLLEINAIKEAKGSEAYWILRAAKEKMTRSPNLPYNLPSHMPTDD